ILFAQTVQGRTVHLGGAADAIVHARLERLAVLVVPGVFGYITVLDEHLFGVPVLRFARHPAAAFEQQDLLAGRCQVISQRAAAGAAANDDDIVGSRHGLLLLHGWRNEALAGSCTGRMESSLFLPTKNSTAAAITKTPVVMA